MPPVALKSYQRECLERLALYCREVRAEAARGSRRPEREAFEAVTGRHDAYLAADTFAGVPYVCLRVPTGGGKTLLGAHAVGVIARHLGYEDRPLVFWVTPTTTIRDQTLRTFKDRGHPNHAALADSLGPSFQVLMLEDAQAMSKAMITADPVVIVTTIQSYRIDEEGNRKVYQDNGYLMDHFENLSARAQALLDRGEGRVALSLANAMKLRGPIVVMDEAHNARTKTSFDSLARFGPLAVLELTATPQHEHDPANEKYASNVLHAVSALELQQEGMIKLPVELESRTDWLDVLKLTIDRRTELAALAAHCHAETGRYIRPIALIQAQPNRRSRENHTAAAVKEKLIDPAGPFKLPAASVAICTGTVDELEANNVDLAASDCPVEYVITVDKLTEGWDCPSAYVLGSIGNVATETAVEQILGRVLRMPQAMPTGISALDRAYAVVQSPDILRTAQNLRDALVKRCGFDGSSVQDAFRISRTADPQRPLALSGMPLMEAPRLHDLPDSLRAKLEYNPGNGMLRVNTPLSFDETRQVRTVVANLIDQQAVDDYWSRERSPGIAVKQLDDYAKPIRIPQLTVVTQSRRTLFEPRELEEYSWNLDQCDPVFDETAFDATYVAGGRTTIGPDAAGGTRVHAVEHIRVPRVWLFDDGEPWSEIELIRWLNSELHKDSRFMGITATESAAWLKRVVAHLTTARGVDLGVLVRKRHALADAVIPRIRDHGYDQVRRVAELLFRDLAAAKVETSYELAFTLAEQQYAPSTQYQGGHAYRRHAFEKMADMNEEEAECAKHIDDHPNVRRWVRNLDREAAGGFSLPLSPGRFFPDFVAELADERIAVIEYKGAHLAKNQDELHKKSVGELWAKQSNGKAAFAWVVDRNWSALDSALATPIA
jgi:type III restriction enzyme